MVKPLFQKNAAGIDSARARQKAREFFPTPFFLDFVRGRGIRKTHFSKLRPRVRPGAYSSRIGRFRLTKNGGLSEERRSIIVAVFDFKSIDFVSLKGVETKKTLPPVKTIVFL